MSKNHCECVSFGRTICIVCELSVMRNVCGTTIHMGATWIEYVKTDVRNVNFCVFPFEQFPQRSTLLSLHSNEKRASWTGFIMDALFKNNQINSSKMSTPSENSILDNTSQAKTFCKVEYYIFTDWIRRRSRKNLTFTHCVTYTH